MFLLRPWLHYRIVRGLHFFLAVSLFVVTACSGGGGSNPGGLVDEFSRIQPNRDSVILNWTNPSLKATEGIYKFTIRYRAMTSLEIPGINDSIDRQLAGRLDGTNQEYLLLLAEAAASSRILDWDNDSLVIEDIFNPTASDNCLYEANADQADRDLDGVGDACDDAIRGLSFIPSQDLIEVRWINPLLPDGPRSQIMGDNLTLSLSASILTVEWNTPSSFPNQANISRILVRGGKMEVAVNISEAINQGRVETELNSLRPNSNHIIEVVAEDAERLNTFYPISKYCVNVFKTSSLVECGAQIPTEESIDNFTLQISGQNYLDEVVLTEEDDAPQVSFRYSDSETSYVRSTYSYNASGLAERNRYDFRLLFSYKDRVSGEIKEEDLASSVSDVSPYGLVYSHGVVLGVNTDEDSLADGIDKDDDNDGILDRNDPVLLAEPGRGGNDPYPTRSALVGEVDVDYGGGQTDLDLYQSGSPSSYELDGLVEGSYYMFSIQAHIREYAGESVAKVLGYDRQGALISGDIFIEDSDYSMEVATSKEGVYLGQNSDGDEWADLLDVDDDNDRLTDALEPAGTDAEGVPCRLVRDCDDDGLDDNEEYYVDGEPLNARGQPNLNELREYETLNGSRVNCLLSADCDGDGVEDDEDPFRIDPTETQDSDEDGIGDNTDNCPYVSNPNQEDRELLMGVVEGDGRGDACEGDRETPEYQYRGSSDRFDLTLIPSAERLEIRWRNVAQVSNNLADLTGVHLGWRILNWDTTSQPLNMNNGVLLNNTRVLSINEIGSADLLSQLRHNRSMAVSREVRPEDANKTLPPLIVYRLELENSYTILRTGTDLFDADFNWYAREDKAYEFNLTFSFGKETLVVYEWTGPIWLLSNIDGDEYSDYGDLNDDNDGLADIDEPMPQCILVADCDGDGVEDGKDAFPLDNSRSADSDGDGIEDEVDNFDGPGLDEDGDGLADGADSCVLSPLNGLSDSYGADEDEDGVAAVCDSNRTEKNAIWFTPQADSVIISWRNNREPLGFRVSYRREGITTINEDPLAPRLHTKAHLSWGNLTAYSHYRLRSLMSGSDYFISLNLTFNEEGTDFVILGNLTSDLYRVRVGANADLDALADEVDSDKDNDGVLNEDEAAGCELLEDCDEDGLSDDVDPFPKDASETKDSDGDGTGDRTDQFVNNNLEAIDSDYDDVGDNVDNCDYYYNPSQANRDGDMKGDLCDEDPDSSMARINITNLATYEDQQILSSEVILNWINPVAIYLPFASPQPLPEPKLRDLRVVILTDGVEATIDNHPRLSIANGFVNETGDLNFLEGDFNLTYGAENTYRIRGLRSGTAYSFELRGFYDYEAADYLRELALGNTGGRVLLARVDLKTSATIASHLQVKDFEVISAEDSIKIGWRNPAILPTGLELRHITVFACQLEDINDSCNATWGGQADLIKSIDRPTPGDFNTFVVKDNVLERGYLYNFTVNATYREDLGGFQTALSAWKLGMFHPSSSPGPMGLRNTGGADFFELSWRNPTSPAYEVFERTGASISRYDLTIRLAGRAGAVVAAASYPSREDSVYSIHSDSFSADWRAGRLYHVSLVAVYTTGQRSQPESIMVSFWPSPAPASNLNVEGGSRTSLFISWDNPNVEDYININEGIANFIITACEESNPSVCLSARKLEVPPKDRTNSERYPVEYDIPKAPDLRYDTSYIVNLVVNYTTGQLSPPITAGEAAQVVFEGYPSVTPIAMSGENAITLLWTNPNEIFRSYMISSFEVTSCRYRDASPTARCGARQTTEYDDSSVLGADAFEAAAEVRLSLDSLDRAYLYDFEVRVNYKRRGTDFFIGTSRAAKTGKAAIYPAAPPTVADLRFAIVEPFETFELRLRPPNVAAVESQGFDRIGESLSHYSLHFEDENGTRYTADWAPTALSNLTGGFYVFSSAELIESPMLPNFPRGAVYSATASISYTTGQKSADSTSLRVSTGPRTPVPKVTTASGDDALTVSWDDSFFTNDFINMGYGLDYSVGLDCPDASDLSSCRRHDQTPGQTGIDFPLAVPAGQRGRILERGKLYTALVAAQYTHSGINIEQWNNQTQGGIYPEPVAITDLVAHSTARGVILNWLPSELPRVDVDFAAHTGYGLEDLVVVAERAEPTEDSLSESKNLTRGARTYLYDDLDSGSLYRFKLEAIYGGANHNDNKATSSIVRGGKYPTVADAKAPTGVRGVQVADGIDMSWNASTDIAKPEFIRTLDYEVADYTVQFCTTWSRGNLGNCREIVGNPVPAGSPNLRIHLDTSEGLERATPYRSLIVRANYRGKESATATPTPKPSSGYSAFDAPAIPFYLNPDTALPVSSIMAAQQPGQELVEVSWTNPNFVDFINIEATVDYLLELCSEDSCVARTSLMAQDPTAPPTSATISFAANNDILYSATANYYVNITLLYSSGQQAKADSSPNFALTRITYPSISSLEVNSGQHTIRISWDAPIDPALGDSLIVDRYLLTASCKEVLNNDCEGVADFTNFTMDLEHPPIGADILTRGVLYDISLVVEYSEGGTIRRSPAVSQIGAIYLLPTVPTPAGLPVIGGIELNWAPIRLPRTAFADYFDYELTNLTLNLRQLSFFSDDAPPRVLDRDPINISIDAVDRTNFAIDFSADEFSLTQPRYLYEASLIATYSLNSSNGIRKFESRSEGSYAGGYPTEEFPPSGGQLSEEDDRIEVSWNEIRAGSPQFNPTGDGDDGRSIQAFRYRYGYHVLRYEVRACDSTNPQLCYFEETMDNRTTSLNITLGEGNDDLTIDLETPYSIAVAAVYSHLSGEAVSSPYVPIANGVISGDDDQDRIKNYFDVDDDGDGLIEIATAAELDAVRYVLDGSGQKLTATAEKNTTGCGGSGGLSACSGYELAADVDLTDYIAANYPTVGWQPLGHDTSDVDGCQGDEFTTTFEGNHFTISGLSINRSNEEHCIGLFGDIRNGEVRNLNLTVVAIEGLERVGGLAGEARGSSIRSVSVHIDRLSGVTSIGGLAGRIGDDTIINTSSVHADTIMGRGIDTGSELVVAIVGGMVGSLSDSRIISSSVHADTIVGRVGLVGGLAGSGRMGSSIESCSVVAGAIRSPIGSSGSVSQTAEVGGLVGFFIGGRILSSSVRTGSIIGIANSGGLVGYFEDSEIIDSRVIADEVTSTIFGVTGGLIGSIFMGNIISSSAILGLMRGPSRVGGLVGSIQSYATIVSSAAILGSMTGYRTDEIPIHVGGLIGEVLSGDIFSSYAITGEIEGTHSIGGLIGFANAGKAISSYAIAERLSGENQIGGILGFSGTQFGTPPTIVSSYGVSWLDGNRDIGGLVGDNTTLSPTVRLSYWDSSVSGITTGDHGTPQTSEALQMPMTYGGIYDLWDDGPTIVDDRGIWCDTDFSGTIEMDEKTNSNAVWNFGTSMEYPAINCGHFSPAEQRLWWSLNRATGRPQLNWDRLDALMDTLPQSSYPDL